eukprot:scaffold24801_cov107-Phaeocystis_antarctica.AAC.1
MSQKNATIITCHASTSLDLAERQSVPVINLLPRPRRGERRGPALGGYFSGVPLVLSIRRPSGTSGRSTLAHHPPAVGWRRIRRWRDDGSCATGVVVLSQGRASCARVSKQIKEGG